METQSGKVRMRMIASNTLEDDVVLRVAIVFVFGVYESKIVQSFEKRRIGLKFDDSRQSGGGPDDHNCQEMNSSGTKTYTMIVPKPRLLSYGHQAKFLFQ